MNRRYRALFACLLAVAACLAAVAWADSRQQAFRRLELERETRLVALQHATRIRYTLEQNLLALEQMASFFAYDEAVSEAEFHSYAAATMKRTPLALRITFVDAAMHVRRVHPFEPNRSILGFDVKSHRGGHNTLLRAKESREAVLSPPLRLIGGEQGFIMAAPIFHDTGLIGFAVSSLRAADFFSSMTLSEVLERYEVRITSSGLTSFVSAPPGSSGSVGSSGGSIVAAVEEFSLGGATWKVRIEPRDAVVARQLHAGRGTFWALGCLLALAAGGLAATGAYWASALYRRIKSQGATLDQTREQLQSATNMLLQAEKMTALGELVAGVAHEINNPLSSIMGYSQLLMGKDLAPDVMKRIKIVHSEAERMARIVRNLLTFARKHTPERRLLGLNGVIEETLELKAYQFRANKIRVETDLAPDLPQTMLDSQQIQQVFLNLFNNAEQAMAEERKGGTLRLLTRRAGDRIEARVSDDGPGIPVEIQKRIFEPFFTTKQVGKGTGLGLSSCYGIVQEHGGAIRVESRPGRGAAFVVEFPIVHLAAAVAEGGAGRPWSSVQSLRILVIEDEQALQDFLADLLRSKGHTVDTASNLPEALQKIAADGLDLIISDVKMPLGSGLDVYKAVLGRSPGLARRIVFTTGDGASDATRRFLEETGNEIVLKPFKIETIESAIASTIRN